MHFEILPSIPGLLATRNCSNEEANLRKFPFPLHGMKKMHNRYWGKMGKWEVGEEKWGEREQN